MYKIARDTSRLLIGVYVDDLLITCASENKIGRFKLHMKDLFKMSDLGLLSYYLGIKVHQNTYGVRPVDEGAKVASRTGPPKSWGL